MILDDAPEFARIMNKLAKIFPKDLDGDIIEVYWDALLMFSIERVQWGFKYCCDTREYQRFPLPYDLIKAIIAASLLKSYGGGQNVLMYEK